MEDNKTISQEELEQLMRDAERYCFKKCVSIKL